MNNDFTLAGQPPRAALLHFFAPLEIAGVSQFGNGNINDSWLVTGQDGARWLLQRLNPHVFANGEGVMRNMRIVTDHLREQVKQCGIKPAEMQIFSMATGRDGSDYYQAPDSSCYRLISYIANTSSFQQLESEEQAAELGRKLGLFHRLLATLEPSRLVDPLPDFHNTPRCLAKLDQALATSWRQMSAELEFCCRFTESRRGLVTVLTKDSERLSSRIIHADPKVANFLFDHSKLRAISLVDLDTVKVGLTLHDLGDALRSCCLTTGEESRPDHGLHFSPNFFVAWVRGYLGEYGLRLTNGDLGRIVAATMLITFELGLRFLTDFLEGDKYFKVHDPQHNLRRAVIQFRAVAEIEKHAEQLEQEVIRLTTLIS